MSVLAHVECRLRQAIDPYRPPEHGADIDTLLWRVGRMRDEIDNAHSWLDRQGAPRESSGEKLTLLGRLETLATR